MTTTTINGYTKIGHWTWAAIRESGNFHLAYGDEPPNLERVIEVQRADIPNLLEWLLMVKREHLLSPPTRQRDTPPSVESEPTMDAGLVAAMSSRLDALEALGSAVTEVSQMVSSLQETVGNALANLGPNPIASDLATKDFVDQSIRRLNGALREHIRHMFAKAVEAAQPGPGLLQRLAKALRPGPVEQAKNKRWTPDATVAAFRFDPAHAVALAEDAAKKAAGE